MILAYILALICLAFYLFGPFLLEKFAEPADADQHKCSKRGQEGDPLKKPRPNSGEVKIIRLTDAGEFIDRCEFTDAMYELTWARPAKFKPVQHQDAQELPTLTVLYIHGWKHNASKNDSDLKAFTALIESLKVTYNGTRQVLGVYIGWNANAGLGWLNNFTFWSKKAVADRIAQSSVVTKIVSALGAVRQSTHERNDRLIVIGHSFGARILFAATGQVMIANAAISHPGAPSLTYKEIPNSADAVILLNPAFEASRFTALSSLSRKEETFPTNQQPILVSISTTADTATRLFFPIGQWLAMERSPLQKTTLGNYKDFQTHTLFESQNGDYGSEADNPLTEFFAADRLCMRRDKKPGVYSQHNPFMVVSTDERIIADHNDIWNATFRQWLTKFLIQMDTRRNNEVQNSIPALQVTNDGPSPENSGLD